MTTGKVERRERCLLFLLASCLVPATIAFLFSAFIFLSFMKEEGVLHEEDYSLCSLMQRRRREGLCFLSFSFAFLFQDDVIPVAYLSSRKLVSIPHLMKYICLRRAGGNSSLGRDVAIVS